jgi:hypothetical protein
MRHEQHQHDLAAMGIPSPQHEVQNEAFRERGFSTRAIAQRCRLWLTDIATTPSSQSMKRSVAPHLIRLLKILVLIKISHTLHNSSKSMFFVLVPYSVVHACKFVAGTSQDARKMTRTTHRRPASNPDGGGRSSNSLRPPPSRHFLRASISFGPHYATATDRLRGRSAVLISHAPSFVELPCTYPRTAACLNSDKWT